VEQDNGNLVWKIENGKAKQVKIKTGIMGDLYAEVIQGIKAGDDIILNPPGSLKEGQAVSPAQGLPQATKGGTL
jgi:HlyD family secretion protein